MLQYELLVLFLFLCVYIMSMVAELFIWFSACCMCRRRFVRYPKGSFRVEFFTSNKYTFYHDLDLKYVGLESMLTDRIMWEMKISETKMLNLFWFTPDNIQS